MVAITGLRKDVIFAAVRGMYTDVAQHPEREYHVPTGREACAFVGYPHDRLARLPGSAIESFAGVGYPFAANVIRPGDIVLEFLEPIPPGLRPREFVRVLEERVEQATAQLVAEGRNLRFK